MPVHGGYGYPAYGKPGKYKYKGKGKGMKYGYGYGRYKGKGKGMKYGYGYYGHGKHKGHKGGKWKW